MALRTVQKTYNNLESMTVNMGPQHPSTHGVLQVILQLDGENVVSAKPEMGYLHRAKEKHAEFKTFHQFIPYTDRMDYLSPMSNNTAFVMTVEKALELDITPRCKYLRTLLCELARMSSHLLALGTGALELGAMTIFMWGFTQREKLYDIFEFISGARFTVSYMRVGGVARGDYPEWRARVRKFLDEYMPFQDEMEAMLVENEIFLQRMENIGIVTAEEAVQLGLTGPSLRGSGVAWDIRKDSPYLAYPEVDFDVAVETKGDCLARFFVRVKELRESWKIAYQCLDLLEACADQPVNVDNPKVIYPGRDNLKRSMEDLIHHFMIASEGFKVPPAEVYHAIESPKGELGFYLVTDGSSKAYRLGIRSPSFINLHGVEPMSEGELLADVVAIIASLDPVMGEVDR
jgi:NADH-quinone oxidoreductase subunit D